jgi:aminoglycoside 6'-N-acetyltransferase
MDRAPGRYHFRRAKAEDLRLILRWQSLPHVQDWWGEPEALTAEDLAGPKFRVMLVEWQGRPFAYMQDYDVHAWPGHHFGYLPEGARGIDQFIGPEDMLGQGHGTAFIRQRMAELFAEGAPVIGTDPHPRNARAIAVYRKAGFKVTGPEEETEWGRVVRMEAWAQG